MKNKIILTTVVMCSLVACVDSQKYTLEGTGVLPTGFDISDYTYSNSVTQIKAEIVGTDVNFYCLNGTTKFANVPAEGSNTVLYCNNDSGCITYYAGVHYNTTPPVGNKDSYMTEVISSFNKGEEAAINNNNTNLGNQSTSFRCIPNSQVGYWSTTAP